MGKPADKAFTNSAEALPNFGGNNKTFDFKFTNEVKKLNYAVIS